MAEGGEATDTQVPSRRRPRVARRLALGSALALIGAKGPVEHIVESGVIVFKSLDHLDAGKTALYRITVTGKAPGNHRFRARLVSDSNEEPLIFEELTKFYGDPIPGSERSNVPPTAYRR